MAGHMGMMVTVYRSADGTDCTNGGDTSKHDRLLVVGPGIPRLFEARGLPVYKLEKRSRGAVALVPVEEREGHRMFGGNFAGTSDSRFPDAVCRVGEMDNFYGAVPVHDRFETGRAW